MNFKSWFYESEGLFGNIKAASGELGLIKNTIKAAQPVKNKGTTVGRMMHTGPKLTQPAKPPSMTSKKPFFQV